MVCFTWHSLFGGKSAQRARVRQEHSGGMFPRLGKLAVHLFQGLKIEKKIFVGLPAVVGESHAVLLCLWAGLSSPAFQLR